MQNLFFPRVVRLAQTGVLALTLCSLMGCTTPVYRKGDVAAISMQKAASEVQFEGRAMDQTIAALRDLAGEPNGDLRVFYKRYSKALDRFIGAAQRTQETGRRMAEKNADYLADWDRQLQAIDYGHIHEVSEARRTEVTNRLDVIQRRYQENQETIQPLISYLSDIRRALSTDLTMAGVDSLKSVVQNANENAAKVQTALDGLTAELTSSSARMSSVAYQTNPPPTAQQ